MQKLLVCAAFMGAGYCCAGYAGNMDCIKFLHAGDEKICMKTLKETSPSLVAKIDNTIYYASAISESGGGISIRYDGVRYSLYNRDDTKYELIHWLSGADALVDGVWRDKVAIGGAMDFVNHGCTWNAAHTGYFSADGFTQYMQMADAPKLDFGTDWYIEVVADVGEPLGTECVLVDLSSLFGATYGTSISLGNNDNLLLPGMLYANNKINLHSAGVGTDKSVYSWGQKAVFITGETQYSINQSRAFLAFDGNRYYSEPYDTLKWNMWEQPFYLFRGVTMRWKGADGFYNVYECGATTIYDIKVWRKK